MIGNSFFLFHRSCRIKQIWLFNCIFKNAWVNSMIFQVKKSRSSRLSSFWNCINNFVFFPTKINFWNQILIIDFAYKNFCCLSTGKYFSESLILESVNPKYDERLFIEFPEKYKFTTCCYKYCFECQNKNKKSIIVHNMYLVNLYFSGNSINNLLSYCV